MSWNEDLLEDQKKAASHIGCHARLLAGPGTGKTLTLTRRICFLIMEKGISPNHILAITFTRAAASELNKRVIEILKDKFKELPQICTLHSFALRQLLKNSKLIETLPQPLRIADKWETRNIIFEDLKENLKSNNEEIKYDIKNIKEKFNQLSADWQTLNADDVEWEKKFPDPRFLAAWRHHRKIFGYTLLSELVYQLKRGLQQYDDFLLESDFSHLLIDEYQDFNRCDLAVISALQNKGIEIFVAGDDDQSIYGFRYAHPEGIRRFDKDYKSSVTFTLDICIRCDRKIIELASFVAGFDEARLEKPLNCHSEANDGEVYILRFSTQNQEAKGVSSICEYLINQKNYKPSEILILLRSDRNTVFSSVIKDTLEAVNIPVSIQSKNIPLETEDGRTFLSFLHLFINQNDSLALKTLFKLRVTKIGVKSFLKIYEIALNHDETFYDAVCRIVNNPSLIPYMGDRIKNEMHKMQSILNNHKSHFDSLKESSGIDDLNLCLNNLSQDIISDPNSRKNVLEYLNSIIKEYLITNHEELIRVLFSSLDNKEQELDEDSVNIITMHKAKGLTAKGIIIIGAEDEIIPGKSYGESEGDERRLLYVSLSRAKHFLAITHCNKRTKSQKYTGREPGKSRRRLTRFLTDAPFDSINGMDFLKNLK